MSPPLVVVEGPETGLARALAEIGPGREIVRAWRADPSVVCTGVVSTASDAAEALLAAVAGAGIVALARADRDLIDRFVDDLRRLGRVDHRAGDEEPARVALTADERGLLDLLLSGRTLGDAAAELHLSRRTADRRLASARRKLRVASTAEALVVHARSRA